uniref:Uncharacterized protein n=1 Tax=Aegilops tauschii TaxID=37682 RepID=M8CEV4_AEGTA
MTACKQTASTGAAATYEADSKSAAKSDGAEERKPSTKCRKGKKAKGKLAVKSNGAEKPKTHDLSDVTRGLAIKRKAAENWKSFSDSDKAPYVAIARVNRILIAEAYEFKKLIFYRFLSLIDTEVDTRDDGQDDESENVNSQDL